MFWGLPVIVATLPMFNPMATASNNGGAQSAQCGHLEHDGREHQAHRVVDEDRREDAGGDGDGHNERPGTLDVCGDQPRGRAEEGRHLEMGDEDHHPKQQDERPVVDGARGLLETQAADGDHQDRADNGGAGTVDAEDRHPPQREHRETCREG